MKIKIFILALVYLFSVSAAYSRSDGFKINTENELQSYIHNKTKTTYLGWTLKQFGQFLLPSIVRADDIDVCTICPLVVNVLIEERRLDMTDIQLSAEAIYFCRLLNIEDERVCEGVIEINTPIFGYVVDNNPKITGKDICGILLETANCPNAANVKWTIDIPKGNTVAKRTPARKSRLRILHITDLHYDPQYTEGKTLDCNEPLCCQRDQENAKDPSRSCGRWGSYNNADTPWNTIVALLNYTTQDTENKFDFVYFTGDVVCHRVWGTSIDHNKELISKIYDLFNEHFNVPVYFVLGNHEGHPVNTFSSEDVKDEALSTQWLYDLMLAKSKALGADDVKETISRGGYYTVSPKPGFRLVVLNDNVCSFENWWLLHDNYDPYGQLAWLAKTLKEAEDAKESVHLLQHIPTTSCIKTWATEFNKIVNRFANTIVAQFYGHAHKDEFYVYYNQSDFSQAINVGWNGASVVADRSNPSYKIIEIDDETFQVVDIGEWTFNLTLANENPNDDLKWYKLYNFTEAFGVPSFDPTDIDDLVVKMAKQHDLINLYYKFKFRNSDVMNQRPCDEGCQKDILCYMVTTEYGVTQRCEEILKIYDEHKSRQ